MESPPKACRINAAELIPSQSSLWEIQIILVRFDLVTFLAGVFLVTFLAGVFLVTFLAGVFLIILFLDTTNILSNCRYPHLNEENKIKIF